MRLTNPGNTANINLVAGKLRVEDMADLGTGVVTLNGALSNTEARHHDDQEPHHGGHGGHLGEHSRPTSTRIMNQSSYTYLHVLGPGSDPSTLTLANNNNYAGFTLVYNNAILAIPTISNFGQPSPIGSDPLNLGIWLGAVDSRPPSTGTSGAGYSTNRVATLTGTYFSGGGGAFGVQNADTNLTLSGQMTGSGSLIKTGDARSYSAIHRTITACRPMSRAGRLDVNNDAAPCRPGQDLRRRDSFSIHGQHHCQPQPNPGRRRPGSDERP